MMKIVYLTDNYVSPALGGIARTTYVLAEALHHKYGYSCYSVYATPASEQNSTDNSFFNEQCLWAGKEQFCSFIRSLGDCIVILQAPCVLAQAVYEGQPVLPKMKIVNVFHGTPGFELVPLNKTIIRYRLKHNIERKWTLKQSLIQCGMQVLPSSLFRKMIRKKYARPYGKATKIVVLSRGIIDQYQAIAPGHREDFTVIPNALPFDNVEIPQNKYANKEVLVVARLDEWHKRIFEVLKIWERIQADQTFSEWTLRILGDGIDKPFYQEYVGKKRIPNIIFEGSRNPLPYYTQASLFLLTSACEGFPMVLLEAEQCGCIPVVYNSFASAQDIMINGENGILVPNNDRKAFVHALKNLMKNETLRKDMSRQCVISCNRYSVDSIAARWNELLQTI